MCEQQLDQIPVNAPIPYASDMPLVAIPFQRGTDPLANYSESSCNSLLERARSWETMLPTWAQDASFGR